jgi:uncharacterized protein YkwD
MAPNGRLNFPGAFGIRSGRVTQDVTGGRMERRAVLANGGMMLGGALWLASCSTPAPPPLAADGKPVPQLYPIKAEDTSVITYRMVDGVNELRGARSLTPLALAPSLTAAAATHSRDMAVQNRPWHFGSDGSSPLLRVQRAGYTGVLLGELISETFETELSTLSAWMSEADTRAVIMDPRASQIGFAWFQEPSGKIWWTMLTGRASDAGLAPSYGSDSTGPLPRF